MSIIPQVAYGLLLPWGYVGLDRLVSRRFPGSGWWRWRGLGRELTVSSVSAAAVLSVSGMWDGVAAAGVMAAVGALIWWYRRRKRRKAAAVLGEKSRAIRSALVRRARERYRPRAVLRPVPGGAR